jgi:Tfp pilus assembly protein PilE
MSKGISLIEILIVVTIFAVLGILVSSSIILTLQGSKKSENLVSVRENLDYSMSIIERQVRNADSIECTSASILSYMDENGKPGSFSCNTVSGDSYIASGSARMTSSTVIATCSFSCNLGDSVSQPYVDIVLQGRHATSTGSQGASVTTNTRIYLRDY